MVELHPLELIVYADLAALERTRLLVLGHLGQWPGFNGSLRTIYAVELVLEEWLTNVFRHGARSAAALRVSTDAKGIELRFEDDGAPFDPTERPRQARPASLEEARPGDLGLLLIEHYARSWSYVREGGRNVMSICIDLPHR
jgi:sigma-B regulation protein RsbU (phosphoserine phosphatase)